MASAGIDGDGGVGIGPTKKQPTPGVGVGVGVGIGVGGVDIGPMLQNTVSAWVSHGGKGPDKSGLGSCSMTASVFKTC